MEKQPLVIGNWKMELSHKASLEVARSVTAQLKGSRMKTEVVICPSYPSLEAAAGVIKQSGRIALGAQNVYHEERGAFTGQISVVQLKEFVSWCIVGHSEVRAACNDTDEMVVHKANMLLTNGITPIVCIGESLEERQADQTAAKIARQIESLLKIADRTVLSRLVITYEPIWAIGTGDLPHPDDVSEVILLIRKHITHAFDQKVAERTRILYGGSVKADNAGRYIGAPRADGVLVGGASVHPGEFVSIIKAVEAAW